MSQEAAAWRHHSGLNGLPVGIALAVRAEAFSASLAARSWVIRQKSGRRAHLLLLQSDRGHASWHGTGVALEAPALLWLPGSIDATVEVGPGAHGFLLSVDDDFLIKIVAGNAEALHLRRTTERVALIAGEALPPHLDTIAQSCRAIVAELRTPRLWRRDADLLAFAAAVSAALAAQRVA